MLTTIKNKKIEYYWDDETERQLSHDAIKRIVNALNNRYTKGSFEQDGFICKWKDITDDDILMFGMTQGWFD